MFRASLDAAKVGIDAPPTLCDASKVRVQGCDRVLRAASCTAGACMAIRMIQGVSRCREISERGTSDAL